MLKKLKESKEKAKKKAVVLGEQYDEILKDMNNTNSKKSGY